MGNEKEIYSLNKKTSNEIDVLKMKINILNKKMDKIKNKCNHSIVFSLSDSSQYKNTDAHMFIINPFGNAGKKLSNLFSTHPETSERIRRLEEMAGQPLN